MGTLPLITTMRFPFPLDDRNTGVLPPTVIHVVIVPEVPVSELSETVTEGTAPTHHCRV
jgi:hypothetical protein